MKKILTLTFAILLLFSVAIPTCAANYDDQVMPCYNNTITTTASFVISDSGLATITLKYIGLPSVVTDASVTYYIEKYTSNGWQDVSGASWEDTLAIPTQTVEQDFQLVSSGTYRLVYEFEVSGRGGSTDIISGNIEKTF